MTDPIHIIARGIPKPGGSKKGFPIRRAGGRIGVAIVDTADNKDWKRAVADAGVLAMKGREPLRVALVVTVLFNLPRPKNHYRKSNGSLTPSAPLDHITKPDATKLWRAAEDALTGIVWADDAQITDQRVQKCYSTMPGVSITVEEVSA